MRDLVLPEPIVTQAEVLASPARFKLLRWGRRASKTRLDFLAALTGHGPGWPEAPMWEGVLHGWDVVWLARDIPQGKAIWGEEIVPRCKGVTGVTLNQQDHFARFEGLGTLYIRSYENVDSIRGIGARLKGAIIDEAAHFHLKYAWGRVLRPALADNKGWAIFSSTTNAGHDGNAEHEVPSYFNRLCLEVQNGQRDADWAEFHATAEQNPRIAPEEFRALCAEYPEGSPELEEEVYARLITAGGGMLFGYLRKDVHGGPPTPPAPETRKVVAADWGWTSPAATLWIETDNGLDGPPMSRVYREWWPTETLPAHWAETVVELSKDEGVEVVIIDSNTKSKGLDGSPSVYEQMVGVFHKAGMRLVAVEKGPTSIKNSTMLLHTYFWTQEGEYVPLLAISDACPLLWKELTALRRGDPKERVTEDPNIPAPHQPDHGYDALRYWAMSRPQPGKVSLEERRKRDRTARGVDGDPASMAELYRERARSAIRQGKAPPPMAAPAKLNQRRKPWERR